ncbi:MAG: CRISPR-associated endonuclease Cas3'', partial [Hydrogenophaga sp.]|nr:CRISPR-associated endonuclease Cas3'' [Hydrogenophaga sp.]
MNRATLASTQCKPADGVIAHVRPDTEVQLLKTHLENVGRLAAIFATKFGLAKHGELIGLLHDLGKYSDEFQAYIKSATGLLNQDEDEEFVDAGELKGKVDHSTSGAQFIWDQLAARSHMHHALAQMLALCVVSHHSGLIDCLKPSSGRPVEDGFSKRMGKPSEKTHLQEVMTKADLSIMKRASALLDDGGLSIAFQQWLRTLHEKAPGASRAEKDQSPAQKFQQGLLVRALFSCLIDADRIDSADFEYPGRGRQRHLGAYEAWEALIQRLELHMGSFPAAHPIDGLRRDISDHCLGASERSTGIYSLTVPTGGGKTLASLRFALHHAKKHGLDRIIYVIPFTSIIDQNAEVVRRILEPSGVKAGTVVLEHHSNLTPDKQSWRSKMVSENWDAPVVYTTTVQLLETLFGSGTRGARRLHQLAKSVLIFDEVQSLPVNCVHLFNNAMNFLADHCKTTVVLCTATQP